MTDDIEITNIERSEQLSCIEELLSPCGIRLGDSAGSHETYRHYCLVASAIRAFVDRGGLDAVSMERLLECLLESYAIIDRVLLSVIEFESRHGPRDEELAELVDLLRRRLLEVEAQRKIAKDLIDKNNERVN